MFQTQCIDVTGKSFTREVAEQWGKLVFRDMNIFVKELSGHVLTQIQLMAYDCLFSPFE